MSLAKVTIHSRPTHSRPTRNASVSGSGLQEEDATISRKVKGTNRTNRTDALRWESACGRVVLLGREMVSPDRFVRIFSFMDKTNVKSALEAARHELTTLHGLVAADGAAPNETWTLDESEIIRQLDGAIESVGSDSHPS